MNILISQETNLVIVGLDYPITQSGDQWASDFGNLCISVDQALLVEGVAPPEYFMTNVYSYSDGVWTVVNQEEYDLQYASIAGNEATIKRKGRDERLVATDWTQAGDLPMSFRTPWATYRQELRDMSSASNWPWNPYPAVPNVPPPSAAANEGITQA
jgi:hypothetical protein